MKKSFKNGVAFAAMLLLATAAAASANVLVNPGFEDGPVGPGAAGWNWWANVNTEATSAVGNQFIPYEGDQLVSMFGPFDGSVVSGMFQEFPTVPGDEWTMSSKSRQWSGDPLVGSNFVVQKIVFKDAGDVEIGAVESVILDAASAVDTWFDNAPIVGTAPAGTVQVEAFILFVQPGFDAGAGQVDNISLEMTGPISVDPSSWADTKALYR